MTVRLLLGPVGSGKTDHALAEIRRLKATDPLATVWVLIASERQKIALRQRVLAASGGIFNLQVFSFEELYRYLAGASGAPPRVLLSAPRAALLLQVLRERWGESGARFQPLPGFVDALARQFDELTLWQVTPADFAARTRGDAKQEELALLYTRYQNRLRDLNLADREGLGAQALDLVRARPALTAPVTGFIVDGLDQFNPLHAALIAAIARRARSALITLTAPEPDLSGTFNRFALARARLLGALEEENAPGFPNEPPIIAFLASRPPENAAQHAIAHLAGQVWASLPAPLPTPQRADGALLGQGVNFLEAPDPAAETAAVLRRVKALLLGAAGVGPACRPDDILIAARDWPLYGPHLLRLGARYALPIACAHGPALAENPAVAALLRLLALPDSGYRRLDVIDALRAPYLAVPGFPADGGLALEEAARRFFVVSGRDEWLAALDALAEGSPGATDEDDADTWLALPAALRETARHTRRALAGLFDALEMADCSETAGFVARIDGWIGAEAAEPGEPPEAAAGFTLGLLARIESDPDPARRDRDRHAVAALKRELKSLRASASLLTQMGVIPDEPVTRAMFLAVLRRALAGETLDDPTGRDGRILATTVNDARGLPHRHVFVLGLSEGIFPAPVPEDPLLLESERRALQERGLNLPLRAERTDDEGLFYEVIGLASDTLTLSRPTLRNGAPWVASALWRTAFAAFDAPPVTTLPVGAVTPAAEAAHPDEAALAVAAAAHDGAMPLGGALAGWLAADDPDRWARMRRAHAVEAARLSRGVAYDGFSGRLANDAWIAALAARFGPDYAWSASQLNTLGECGFRFFSQRLLHLDPLEPPEEGMDVLQRGRLLHEVLERTYRRIQQAEWPIRPDFAEPALAVLNEEAAAAFADAPRAQNFRPRPGWAQEQARLRAQLAAVVAADFSGSVVSRVSEHAPAGLPGDRFVIWLEGAYDQPALLETADGQPVRVRGRFDRVDRQGDRWLILDYKSGSTRIPTEHTLRGRNFQMLIYLLALRAQTPGAIAGGFFWHLPDQAPSGALWLDTPEGETTVAEGVGHIARRIAEAQRGDFAVRPNGLEESRCSRYCDYSKFCRMAVTTRRPTESAP